MTKTNRNKGINTPRMTSVMACGLILVRNENQMSIYKKLHEKKCAICQFNSNKESTHLGGCLTTETSKKIKETKETLNAMADLQTALQDTHEVFSFGDNIYMTSLK